MNEFEQRIAEALYESIQHRSNYSQRSLQSAEFRAGVSDLGFCSERVRRMIDQQVPEETDVLAAFIGTAIGDELEEAVAEHFPYEAVIQSEVEVTLNGDGGRVYRLTGHPDMLFPEINLVLDGKTSFGLETVRRTGPSLSQQFQRHLYGLGAYHAGLFPGAESESDVLVGNSWIDRSGQEKRVHVQIEPLNLEVVGEAERWLDDVVYAYVHGQEARKEPPREVCAVACGFYETCRAPDTDVEGLLTDETVLTSVDLYAEGNELEKRGKALKKEAQNNLLGVAGSTGEFTVRWIHVNESEIKAGTRKAYDRLDIKPIRKKG